VLACVLPHATVAQSVKKPVRPFPGNAKADIWILAGQSNMGGWGLLKAPIETDPRVMDFKNSFWAVAEKPTHKNCVSPSWDPKGKGSVRENILLQRDQFRLPAGMTPEEWLRQAEGRGLILGGVGPGLFLPRT